MFNKILIIAIFLVLSPVILATNKGSAGMLRQQGSQIAAAATAGTPQCFATGAPTVCSTYVAVAGFYGCRGGELLVSTSSDDKTLEACAKYAATLKAGMFSYNPPDQHCIPFTAEQCRTKGASTYTLGAANPRVRRHTRSTTLRRRR
jgi:hypothetical protein